MATTNYARGAALERRVAREWEADGWDVTRVAGSHSPKDLVCCRAGETVYIQVKGDRAGPFASFGPAYRAALLATAKKAGARALLIWRDSKNRLVHLPPSEWPATTGGEDGG